MCELFIALLVIAGNNLNFLGLYSLLLESGVICGRPIEHDKIQKIELKTLNIK